MRRRADHTQVTLYLARAQSQRLAGRAASVGRSISEHLRCLVEQDLSAASGGADAWSVGAALGPIIVEALKAVAEKTGTNWPDILAVVDQYPHQPFKPSAPLEKHYVHNREGEPVSAVRPVPGGVAISSEQRTQPKSGGVGAHPDRNDGTRPDRPVIPRDRTAEGKVGKGRGETHASP